VARDGRLGLGERQLHQRHGAVPGVSLAHQAAPSADDTRGVVEVQGAGDVRGGDLAHAVSDHDRGLDPPGAPQLADGDLHGEERGLDDIHGLEGLRVVRGEEQVEEREAGVNADRRVAP
jgi:hypothetical protein